MTQPDAVKTLRDMGTAPYSDAIDAVEEKKAELNGLISRLDERAREYTLPAQQAWLEHDEATIRLIQARLEETDLALDVLRSIQETVLEAEAKHGPGQMALLGIVNTPDEADIIAELQRQLAEAESIIEQYAVAGGHVPEPKTGSTGARIEELDQAELERIREALMAYTDAAAPVTGAVIKTVGQALKKAEHLKGYQELHPQDRVRFISILCKYLAAQGEEARNELTLHGVRITASGVFKLFSDRAGKATYVYLDAEKGEWE